MTLASSAANLSQKQQARQNAIRTKIENNPTLYEALSPKFAPSFNSDSILPILAQLYITEYMSRHPKELDVDHGGGTIKVPTTENVWVDKDVILYYAKKFIDDPTFDGIRLYNAQYPMNAPEIDSGLDSTTRGRHTIILTATKSDGNNGHNDWYGAQSGVYIYDYNSLCPDKCAGAKLGGH